MPTCKKCETKFPTYIEIDGVQKNLNKRKYCLTCSPYKKHNTRKLDETVNTDNEKLCPRCSTIKPVTEFYKRRDRNDPSAYCITCSGEQTQERIKERKKQCVEYLGGLCESCGYDDHYVGFDFHHLDRSTKLFDISSKLRWSFEKLKPELDKCALLCCRCHREIEAGVRECPRKKCACSSTG